MMNLFHARTRPLRRPRIGAAVAALAVAAIALSGCSSASSPSTDAAATSSGPWTFTDDLGKTITLDHQPTKVAGLTDAVVSLMQYGIKPVAAFGYESIKTDKRFDAFDISGVTELGATYGEIDVEKLIEAAPDIIVSHIYPTDTKGTLDKAEPDYGFNDLAQQAQIAKIAPIVTLVIGGDGDDVVNRTTELASALGATPEKIAATKKTYTDAKADLQAAATESKGLKVVALYADADGVNVVKAPDDPQFRLYSTLGVDFFTPTPKGYYWGNYSWENAGKISADLVLLSQSGYQKDELSKQPTLAETPAVKAGQVDTWVSAGLDYVSQADYMTQLAGYLRAAKVVNA